MKETGNINDLWICEKCGRFSYSHFYEHATRLTRNNYCRGKVIRFRTYLQKSRVTRR